MGQVHTGYLLQFRNALGDSGITSITFKGGNVIFSIEKFFPQGRGTVSTSISVDDLCKSGDDPLYDSIKKVVEMAKKLDSD